MTGRDLIIYILKNNLENVDVLGEDLFLGFPTALEVAARFNVGLATVRAWVVSDYLDAVEFDGEIYIVPASLERFTESKKQGGNGCLKE